MEEKFLKKETKIYAITLSVLIAISLIALLIIGIVSGNFLKISMYGTSIIALIVSILIGTLQIIVFSNYKNQKRYLCADGIFYICLASLIGIIMLLYPLSYAEIITNFNLKYFIVIFAYSFAIWKIIVSVISIKHKHYNSTLEVIISLLWLLNATSTLLTTFINTEYVGNIMLISTNYILCLVFIVYILYSYVFKVPNYLITEKGKEILNEEIQIKNNRINRMNNTLNNNNTNVSSNNKEETLEEKLMKLQSLKDRKFINEEEYEQRKKKLLDDEL